jgi:hypothetical protein
MIVGLEVMSLSQGLIQGADNIIYFFKFSVAAIIIITAHRYIIAVLLIGLNRPLVHTLL